MFKIGDFSRVAQVTVKALRYYGKLGLLQPRWIDRYSGYRYYTLDQLPRLNRILALKDLGFSLDQMHQVLIDELPTAELRGMLRAKQAELERHIRSEQERLDRVEARLRQIEREGSLPLYDIVLKTVPPQSVIGLRRVVARFSAMGMLFDELESTLKSSSLPRDPHYQGMAIYYDSEYRDREVDVEAAVPLTRPARPVGNTRVHTLPGSEASACAVHQGSPAEIGEAYEAVLAWVEQNGYQVSGPNRDLYLHGPAQAQEAAECVTEIQFPVKRKRVYSLAAKETKDMEPKFVSKEAFTVVGLLYHGTNENNDIPAVWTKLMERGADLQAAGKTLDPYGVCKMPDEDGSFDYLAGFEIVGEFEAPEGMEVWNLPAKTYAVFTTTLPKVKETYEYIYHTWLPESGYQPADSFDFEYYDEHFNGQDPTSIFYIYIPVVKS